MRYMWNILFFLTVLMVSMPASAAGELKNYEESLEKWRRSGIENYRIKVEYRSFGPLSGIWELEVRKGMVESFSFNGSTDKKYSGAAAQFTMESIYRRGVPSVEKGLKIPMIVKTGFDSTNGYIKSVRRIRNPEFAGKVKETGFIINIIWLKPYISGGEKR